MLWKFQKGLNFGIYNWYFGIDTGKGDYKFNITILEEDYGRIFLFWRFYAYKYYIKMPLF